MQRDENKKIEDNMNYKANKAKMQGDDNLKVAGLPGIPKNLTVDDAIKTFKMSLDREPKNLQEVIEFFKKRKLSKAQSTLTQV